MRERYVADKVPRDVAAKERLFNQYLHERQLEKTARTTGLVQTSPTGGKMAAYQKSAYGDDSVSDLVRDFTKHQVKERREQEAEEREHSERGEYVRQRQNSTRRAYQYYYAQEMKVRKPWSWCNTHFILFYLRSSVKRRTYPTHTPSITFDRTVPLSCSKR